LKTDVTFKQRTEKSAAIMAQNERWIPGGVVSLNRKVEPNLCFTRGRGSRVWDVDGNEYIDYQAAFSAVFLGHNDPDVNAAVAAALQDDRVLMGAGPTDREGELAELICASVPGVEKVQITNTGSEATFHAIRIARAHTGRDDVIVMQGGYNGWHNDVAANVISELSVIGPRVSPGEYPFDAISAGIPVSNQRHVHIVNYNDLESIRYVAKRYPIACLILEPILQNIGVVKPRPGYLEGLRKVADECGFLLIFDEVKTGFRHALGGYQSLCGVTPDLCTFGKAVANGYPIGLVGGTGQVHGLFRASREKEAGPDCRYLQRASDSDGRGDCNGPEADGAGACGLSAYRADGSSTGIGPEGSAAAQRPSLSSHAPGLGALCLFHGSRAGGLS